VALSWECEHKRAGKQAVESRTATAAIKIGKRDLAAERAKSVKKWRTTGEIKAEPGETE